MPKDLLEPRSGGGGTDFPDDVGRLLNTNCWALERPWGRDWQDIGIRSDFICASSEIEGWKDNL